jgi:hypothetical protein
MVVLALQPKGYAASLFYTPFDRTSTNCSSFPMEHVNISRMLNSGMLARIAGKPARDENEA